MPLITAEEASQIRDEFLPLFSSLEAYELSRQRFREKFPRPTAESFRRWMVEDLAVDRAMNGAAPVAAPVLPLRQSFELSDCRHCGGKRYLHADVPVGHADFGRAIPCVFCDDSAHKSACEVCRKPAILSGYLGPETCTVPADWQPGDTIPDDWQPVHGGHR